jgi:type I restriction enzyme S subunit
VHTSIKASILTKRFDVRYNTSEKHEEDCSWSLGELKKIIVRDPNCYGFKYAQIGIPIIRISDMKQPFIDFSRVALISKDVHQTFSKTHLQPYDILISVRGMSTGKVSIYLGEYEQANISPNIIIVRLKDVSLAPYVAMILISDIGQSQIQCFFSGGGKPSLTAPMVNAIRIPKPSEDKLKQINVLFEDAKEKRKEGKKLLDKIESIFKAEFNGFEVKKKIFSIRKLEELSYRWDPHYHNEGFVKLRKFLEDRKDTSKNIKCYGNEKKEPANNFDKKEKIEYIEISSINNLTGIIDSAQYDYPELLPTTAKIEVSSGDILISKVRPYLNANTIVVKGSELVRTVASKNAFAIFNTENLYYKYYLIAFLRSSVGISQIEMYQSGTTYPTVSDDDIKKIKVLEIQKDQMDLINTNYSNYVSIKITEEFAKKAILDLLDEN